MDEIHEYHEGTVGCHVLTGGHSIKPSDWNRFMNFWDKKRSA